jgi:poly-gamma-glutamate synthesis protein (capsule biosynthesis protein)
LQNIKDTGFDILTLANNHALDRSSLGVDKTIEAAHAVGLKTTGTRASYDRSADFESIAQIKDMRIAFIGCTEMTNGIPDKKQQISKCYDNGILNRISELHADSSIDAVIVIPHWGVEYAANPDSNQQLYAKKYLEAGATAVIGSHPHVLEPWEKYTTTDGRETLIVYSLGNFVAYQATLPRKTGAVVYLGLSKQSPQEKARIFAASYTPTYRDGETVYPISEKSAADILNQAALNFGRNNRINPADRLAEKMCH